MHPFQRVTAPVVILFLICSTVVYPLRYGIMAVWAYSG